MKFIQSLRTATGVPIDVFNELKEHLEPFRGRFQSFDLDEVLTLLLVHLRHGDSFNYLHAAVNRVRVNTPIKLETISKSIRKSLLILSGPNPYKMETRLIDNENDSQSSSQQSHNSNQQDHSRSDDYHDDSKNCYYASKAFDGLREGQNIGLFFRSNVGWESHDMQTYLIEGTSWFERCMQQSRLYLVDQVERLNNSPTQVISSK